MGRIDRWHGNFGESGFIVCIGFRGNELRISTVLASRKNSATAQAEFCRCIGMQLTCADRWMRQTRALFTLRLSLVVGLIAFHSSQMRANVVITSPTGGNNVPADKALNSISS